MADKKYGKPLAIDLSCSRYGGARAVGSFHAKIFRKPSAAIIDNRAIRLVHHKSP